MGPATGYDRSSAPKYVCGLVDSSHAMSLPPLLFEFIFFHFLKFRLSFVSPTLHNLGNDVTLVVFAAAARHVITRHDEPRHRHGCFHGDCFHNQQSMLGCWG